MNFTLTEDQMKALDKILDFCSPTNTKLVFLLTGSAGTGKTALIQKVMELTDLTVMGLAPTHKAKNVLMHRMLGTGVTTLASFLQKRRQHSYIGTHVFKTEGVPEVLHQLYVLDEVSMVSDTDFDQLKRICRTTRSKILAIGDEYQIPAISQEMERVDGGDVLVKKVCSVFSIADRYRYNLRQIVRQKSESIIIKVATRIRNDICKDICLSKDFPELEIKNDDMYDMFLKMDILKTKIISYTNISVETHNKTVRKNIFPDLDDIIVKGDILMGYKNIGYPVLFIENSMDYVVIKVTHEKNGLNQKMVGYTATLEEIDTENKKRTTCFFPTLNHPSNESKLRLLINLAKKVNSHQSTKQDYAKYKNLKDRLLFLQDVYEYDDRLWNTDEFRREHPLMFICLSEFDEGTIEQVKDIYGNIIEDRYKDDKPIGEQETLASRFCIFEKDLDYGYACTAHKSQGSTFETIFVNEGDFSKLKNRVDRRTGLIENRIKERNQLKYVAVTRASNNLYIIV